MQANHSNQIDLLIAFSRRSLWLTLGLTLLLGGYAVLINLYPESEAAAMAGRFAALFPIVIIIAVAALRGTLKGASGDPSAPAMKHMLGDELRQQSLRLAYRNGLFAVLLAQPVLALLLTWASAAQAVALMASATAMIGMAVVLASVLVYDR